jgi:hypothetical protein
MKLIAQRKIAQWRMYIPEDEAYYSEKDSSAGDV